MRESDCEPMARKRKLSVSEAGMLPLVDSGSVPKAVSQCWANRSLWARCLTACRDDQHDRPGYAHGYPKHCWSFLLRWILQSAQDVRAGSCPGRNCSFRYTCCGSSSLSISMRCSTGNSRPVRLKTSSLTQRLRKWQASIPRPHRLAAGRCETHDTRQPFLQWPPRKALPDFLHGLRTLHRAAALPR